MQILSQSHFFKLKYVLGNDIRHIILQNNICMQYLNIKHAHK